MFCCTNNGPGSPGRGRNITSIMDNRVAGIDDDDHKEPQKDPQRDQLSSEFPQMNSPEGINPSVATTIPLPQSMGVCVVADQSDEDHYNVTDAELSIGPQYVMTHDCDTEVYSQAWGSQGDSEQDENQQKSVQNVQNIQNVQNACDNKVTNPEKNLQYAYHNRLEGKYNPNVHNGRNYKKNTHIADSSNQQCNCKNDEHHISCTFVELNPSAFINSLDLQQNVSIDFMITVENDFSNIQFDSTRQHNSHHNSHHHSHHNSQHNSTFAASSIEKNYPLSYLRSTTFVPKNSQYISTIQPFQAKSQSSALNSSFTIIKTDNSTDFPPSISNPRSPPTPYTYINPATMSVNLCSTVDRVGSVRSSDGSRQYIQQNDVHNTQRGVNTQHSMYRSHSRGINTPSYDIRPLVGNNLDKNLIDFAAKNDQKGGQIVNGAQNKQQFGSNDYYYHDNDDDSDDEEDYARYDLETLLQISQFKRNVLNVVNNRLNIPNDELPKMYPSPSPSPSPAHFFNVKNSNINNINSSKLSSDEFVQLATAQLSVSFATKIGVKMRNEFLQKEESKLQDIILDEEISPTNCHYTSTKKHLFQQSSPKIQIENEEPHQGNQNSHFNDDNYQLYMNNIDTNPLIIGKGHNLSRLYPENVVQSATQLKQFEISSQKIFKLKQEKFQQQNQQIIDHFFPNYFSQFDDEFSQNDYNSSPFKCFFNLATEYLTLLLSQVSTMPNSYCNMNEIKKYEKFVTECFDYIYDQNSDDYLDDEIQKLYKSHKMVKELSQKSTKLQSNNVNNCYYNFPPPLQLPPSLPPPPSPSPSPVPAITSYFQHPDCNSDLSLPRHHPHFVASTTWCDESENVRKFGITLADYPSFGQEFSHRQLIDSKGNKRKAPSFGPGSLLYNLPLVTPLPNGFRNIAPDVIQREEIQFNPDGLDLLTDSQRFFNRMDLGQNSYLFIKKTTNNNNNNNNNSSQKYPNNHFFAQFSSSKPQFQPLDIIRLQLRNNDDNDDDDDDEETRRNVKKCHYYTTKDFESSRLVSLSLGNGFYNGTYEKNYLYKKFKKIQKVGLPKKFDPAYEFTLFAEKSRQVFNNNSINANSMLEHVSTHNQ